MTSDYKNEGLIVANDPVYFPVLDRHKFQLVI